METNTSAPKVISHEHEGFFYVEYDGSFYKGCRRCGGTGHYSFNGYDSYCYLCQNVLENRLGDEFPDEAAAQKWCHGRAVGKARRDEKREAERLAKLARRQAAWDKLAAEYPDVWALVSKAADLDGTGDPHAERDSFVASLASKLWDFDERQYTERQIAALQKVAERRTQRQAEAAANPAPSGRVVVTGEIVSTKVVDGEYGISYKILVKDDQGFKVWCSLPKAQADEAYDAWLAEVEANGHSIYDFGSAVWFLGTEGDTYNGIKGRRITFTATLQPSRDDRSFAFGSRPTKGAWL